MTLAITVVSVILLLALAVTLGAGYYMYRFCTVRDNSGKRQKNYWETPLEVSSSYSDEVRATMLEGEEYIKSHITEVHRIKSHDGLTLVAHSVEGESNMSPRGVVVMSHGYRSHAVNDFSCAVKAMNERGFICLLIDQRGHGYSEGNKIGFGATEKYDIVRWCAYAGEHFDLPVVLDGVSMGSSILMMGGEVGYPDCVRAIICDCGYSNQGEICRLTLKKWFGLPPFPVYYAAKLFIRLFAGYDIDKTDTEKGLAELKKRKLPMLIAHGDADGFVPYSMSEHNYSVVQNDNVEMFTAEGADHGMSFLVKKDEYSAAIDRLFDRAGL